jgi:hypothetical protein
MMAENQPETQPQAAAGDSGTKDYILDEKSVVSEVVVDNKTVTKSKSAKLTQDQYDRASADPDVKLVEPKEE